MENIEAKLTEMQNKIESIEKKIDLIMQHHKIELSKKSDPLPYTGIKEFQMPKE